MADTSAAPSLKGTKTEQNLATAYVAESTAVTRYTIYANVAKKQNYFFYSNIFTETAANELHHSKIFLNFLLEGGAAPGPVTVDSGNISDTLTNLKISAQEELHEGVELYTEAAKVAREEGFENIAEKFESIATIENHHRERFLAMASEIENGTTWKRANPIKWQCEVCGYIYEGTEPPKVCPACSHPYQHYFPEPQDQF